jgi:FAD/FMN-containing dehydrogenase
MTMFTRRRFLQVAARAGAGLAVAPYALARQPAAGTPILVNDIHSQLNPTYVRALTQPNGLAGVQATVRQSVRAGQAISIAGGRHAMGGQQFGDDTLLLDTRAMNRVLAFDSEHGLVEAEAGIQWPELIDHLIRIQKGRPQQWGIIQKQTGADRLCLGGALAANVHGRGLIFKPIIDNVESFRLVDATGEVKLCSRAENSDLFKLAIGGYGLFGVIASVTLRLMPRQKLQRTVEIIDVDDLMPAFERRIADGYLYGDCQFSVDPGSSGFLKKGVFSCYRPVDESTPAPAEQKQLSADEWRKLYFLAHADPARAFDVYSSYYLATNGQIYWSDTHELSTYIDDYHKAVDRRTGSRWPGSEMITEVYVPRAALSRFLDTLAGDFRRYDVKIIYGTIRLIEKDEECFLHWADKSYACIVMNLHISHSPQGIVKAANDFRRVIDGAIEHGGSYYLTYHRWATRAQLDICYPQMAEFLELKRKHDAKETFQSDWYRHYRRMFA